MPTTRVEIFIRDYEVTPHHLKIRLGIPSLYIDAGNWFRRRHLPHAKSGEFAWYKNDGGGSKPVDQETLDDVLNKLVVQHPSLGKIADIFDIKWCP